MTKKEDENKVKFAIPPWQCFPLTLLFAVFIASWIAKLMGYPWEAWKGFKPTLYISTVGVILVFLAPLLKKLQKRGIMERSKSEKELYK